MGGKHKYRPGKPSEAVASPGFVEIPYVSRGGLKLRRALDEFGIDCTGLRCADLGCSTGGFTDCLLQAGAARVFAVDTAYGELAWKIRRDDRVTVMERTNAVHTGPPAEVVETGGVDLVVIDLGWTPQSRAIPAALDWVYGRGSARIVSLIKPHYEVEKSELGEKGVLDHARAAEVTESVRAAMPGLGVRVLGCIESPIIGGKRSGSGKGTGNKEWLVLLEAIDAPG